jgi:hypothetical protein
LAVEGLLDLAFGFAEEVGHVGLLRVDVFEIDVLLFISRCCCCVFRRNWSDGPSAMNSYILTISACERHRCPTMTMTTLHFLQCVQT